MKQGLIILIFLSVITYQVKAQEPGGRRDRGGFSLATLSGANKQVADSLLVTDSLTTDRITAFRVDPDFGGTFVAPMDTNRLNSSNNTLPEAKSLAVGYTGNVGSPIQTKIFTERKEARDFIFADAYDYYITTPENALFYDTRVPYTDVMYTQEGSSLNKNDHFKGILTTNFGKAVNIGGEMDYIYSRGQYNSNGNKLLSYRIFGSYRSDKYELNAYARNFNFVNYENGGLSNDNYLLNPDNYSLGTQSIKTTDFPVRMTNTWNRVRGKQYYLTHRYNLGFYRTLTEKDEDGEDIEVFVPVSSIIHTLDYEDNRRHFTSNMDTIDLVYNNRVYGLDPSLTDRTSMWNLKNTVALSLREGFQDWVKFGLTAYLRLEKRRFKLPAKVPGYSYGDIDENGNEIYGWIGEPKLNFDFSMNEIYDEFSTYIGAELYKTQGSIFTFNAKGELAVIGDDLGELRLEGDARTQFNLLKKEASVKLNGYFKNITPAFYQRHNHSRYFWWDESLSNIQHLNLGAEIHLASTGTRLSANVESIQNYVYFGSDGTPKQYDSNLQIITARLKQDIKYRAFGWENDVAWQLSSNEDVLPLPALSAHSNMYLHFKLFKVLSMQIGAELYYHTKYYAPYYEPATQQFQLQWEDDKKTKIGNYPLMNAYLNMHLKQTRFFLMAYNLSSKFADPNYFSLPHYPISPMVLKMGVIVTFNN